MDYAELFGYMIDEAKSKNGLSANQVSKLCTDLGHDVSSTYISQIRNRKLSPPADEVSRAIAKACGKHEDLLVIQKHYDNLPEAFKRLIANLRAALILVVIPLLCISDADRIAIVEQELENMPIMELLTMAAEIDIDTVRKGIEELEPSDMLNMAGPPYPVQDDAMSPRIPMGAQVHTWAYETTHEYKDGDILCYHKAGDSAFYVRKAIFLDDGHTEFHAIAYNNDLPEKLAMKDIFLYGKVINMTVDFK